MLWHTDASEVIDPNALIASVSLGCPGVLCFSPKFGTPFAEQWYLKNVEKRMQNYRDKGVRGCVALFPGDLMIMCGSFQEHMLQRTLPFSHIKPYILRAFPGLTLTPLGSEQLKCPGIYPWCGLGTSCTETS